MSGRLTPREKLMELLEALGYELPFYGISGLKGWARMHAKYDDTLVTWDTFAHLKGCLVHVVSWDTMTACARRGFTIDVDDSVHYVTALSKDRTGNR